MAPPTARSLLWDRTEALGRGTPNNDRAFFGVISRFGSRVCGLLLFLPSVVPEARSSSLPRAVHTPIRTMRHAIVWVVAAMRVETFAMSSESCEADVQEADPRLAEVQRWLKENGDRRDHLPADFVKVLTAGAWNRSALAFDLLSQLDQPHASAEVLGSVAIAMARQGRLREAASAFERAAAMPPASVQRFTKHRLHNLELVHGQGRAPQQDVQSFPRQHDGTGTEDGGWGSGSARVDIGPDCDIDVRTNLSEAEFESRYVLEGRPVLLPLHQVAARCLDDGPWPCTEPGCPSDPLGCAQLAELDTCDRSFEKVWDAPPAGLAEVVVSSQCRLSCGACDVSTRPGAAAASPADALLWTRGELLRRAGACVVPLVSSSGVVDHQYRAGAHAAAGLGERQATLADFIQAEMRGGQVAGLGKEGEGDAGGGGAQEKEEEADPPYVVATRPGRGTAATTPLAQQRVQCWRILDGAMRLTGLGQLRTAFLTDDAHHKRILFAGPAGSGTGFHDHSNTFSLMPYGRKRWLLLPPSGLYEPVEDGDEQQQQQQQQQPLSREASGKLTSTAWLRRHDEAGGKERLPIAPLRCVQPAGTALFVPSGWKHATINLEDSVGVAVEVGDADVIERAQRAAAASAT